MSTPDHWNAVYEGKPAEDVSWFQPQALLSLELIAASGAARSAAILDVGAGASRLVDGLLARGYSDLTVLDIAESALAVTRTRLSGAPVHFVVADVTTWKAPRPYDLWHDRAVFHFLTSESQRHAYREALVRAVPVGGHAIIATFAADGPARCSGLPVQRYSSDALAAELAGVLRPLDVRAEHHRTPQGTAQSFIYVLFERV